MYPVGHPHWNEPTVLIHAALSAHGLSVAHSSTSKQFPFFPFPKNLVSRRVYVRLVRLEFLSTIKEDFDSKKTLDFNRAYSRDLSL